MTDANTLASLIIKELGLSKEMLHQKVDQIAERMVERRLNSQRFDDLILCAINRALKQSNTWLKEDHLNAMIKNTVVQEIKRLLMDRMVISVEGFQFPSQQEGEPTR